MHRRKRRPIQKRKKGLSLAELAMLIGIVLSIGWAVRGKLDFFAMLIGQTPNNAFRETAHLYAPRLCELNDFGIRVSDCVTFGNVRCTDIAQTVIYKCLAKTRKKSIPKKLTLSEQKLLMQTSNQCIRNLWASTVFEHFPVDTKNYKCRMEGH